MESSVWLRDEPQGKEGCANRWIDLLLTSNFKSLSKIDPFGPDRRLAWISGCFTGRGKAAAGPASVQGTKGS